MPTRYTRVQVRSIILTMIAAAALLIGISLLAAQAGKTNDQLPVVTERAAFVSRKISNSSDGPTYYLRFKTESVRWVTFRVDRLDFDRLQIGDTGELTTQGDFYFKFVKDPPDGKRPHSMVISDYRYECDFLRKFPLILAVAIQLFLLPVLIVMIKNSPIGQRTAQDVVAVSKCIRKKTCYITFQGQSFRRKEFAVGDFARYEKISEGDRGELRFRFKSLLSFERTFSAGKE